MKLESCIFLHLINRPGDRRQHAGGTAVGGKGDCGGEGDSNWRRRRQCGGREGDGLPAAAAARGSGACVGDELVGQDGIKKCEISRNCLWSFESLKRAQIA